MVAGWLLTGVIGVLVGFGGSCGNPGGGFRVLSCAGATWGSVGVLGGGICIETLLVVGVAIGGDSSSVGIVVGMRTIACGFAFQPKGITLGIILKLLRMTT